LKAYEGAPVYHAYNLFEQELESRSAIQDVSHRATLSDFAKSTFLRVSGPAKVVDAALLKAIVSRSNQLVDSFAYVTHFKEVEEARTKVAAAGPPRDKNSRVKASNPQEGVSRLASHLADLESSFTGRMEYEKILATHRRHVGVCMNARKLLQNALSSPHNFRFAEARALAEAFGFRLSRVRGSHHIFTHPAVPELLNLQEVHGQAKPYQIRQLLQLVERHNLTLGGTE
jgi:hypothetical protein